MRGLAQTSSLGCDRWNRLVGFAWAHVLDACGLDARSTVVEIGPGFTDKVGHGLAALGFRGRLVLIEPTAAACEWASMRYRELLPGAEIVALLASISDAAAWNGARVDAVVANHVLDDMLLSAAIEPSAREPVFAAMRPRAHCAASFVRAWHGLAADPQRLGSLVSAVADDFAAFAASIRPRLVAVHQYPSWRHDRNGLAFIHAQSIRVLQVLAQRLRRLGLERVDSRGVQPAHDPHEWLLMSPSASWRAVS